MGGGGRGAGVGVNRLITLNQLPRETIDRKQQLKVFLGGPPVHFLTLIFVFLIAGKIGGGGGGEKLVEGREGGREEVGWGGWRGRRGR